jgi:isoamylase
VQLLLFDQADDAYPSRTVTLDPVTSRNRHYWHVFVPQIGVGQIYAFRVDGSFVPEQGLRFDPQKILLDPYGRAIARPANYSRARHAVNAQAREVLTIAWQGDQHP